MFCIKSFRGAFCRFIFRESLTLAIGSSPFLIPPWPPSSPRVLECSSPLVNTYSDYPSSSRLRHFIPPRKCHFRTRSPRAFSRPPHGIYIAFGCSLRVSVQSSQCYYRRHRCYWTSMAHPQRLPCRRLCLCRSHLCRTERVCRVSCTAKRRHTPTNCNSRRVTCRFIFPLRHERYVVCP